jgi:hypothetical protein
LDYWDILVIQHLGNIHQLAKLFCNLLKDVIFTGYNNGHSRDAWIIRAAYGKGFYVKPPPCKEPGHPGKNSGPVFN